MTKCMNRLGSHNHWIEMFALLYVVKPWMTKRWKEWLERWSNWRGEFGVNRGPCSDMVTGDDDDGGASNHSIVWHI